MNGTSRNQNVGKKLIWRYIIYRKTKQRKYGMNGNTALKKMTAYNPATNKNGLSLRQAVSANCALCLGFYVDGKHDCEMPECPLYPWAPYKKKTI
jgi:hypothetical protein